MTSDALDQRCHDEESPPKPDATAIAASPDIGFAGPMAVVASASMTGLRSSPPAGRSGWRTGWPMAGLLCCLVLPSAVGGDFKGRVVRVVDGDTIEVQGFSRRTQRVRIQGIDAPEANQAFGARAKQRLADLVEDKVVTVEADKRDRHGRTLGKVMVGGEDVGLALVREGYAWWYRDYSRDLGLVDRVLYPLAEFQARWGDSGLWADPDPLAPWEFRRR